METIPERSVGHQSAVVNKWSFDIKNTDIFMYEKDSYIYRVKEEISRQDRWMCARNTLQSTKVNC